MRETFGEIAYDKQYDLYESFFDHTWAAKLADAVADTKLELAVATLLFTWKAAAKTHEHPWLIIETIKGYATGADSSSIFSAQTIDVLKTCLLRELGSPLSVEMRDRILSAMDRIGQNGRVMEIATKKEAIPDAHWMELWNAFLSHKEFILTIWGSERLCYMSLYFSYEDLVRESARIVADKPALDVWKHGKKGTDNFSLIFGESLTDLCMRDSHVRFAKSVRNALVHSGGRLPSNFCNQNPPLTILDNTIQIRASDTITLHNLLKERVTRLILTTAELLSRKRPI